MELKKLWPLAVILLVLVVIGALKQSRPTSHTIDKEAGLELLVPDDFLVSDIHRLCFTMAGKSAEAIVLARNEDKVWCVESLYNVPADESKVETLLGKVKKLEGEYRSSLGEVLEDFGLEEGKCLEVACYKKEDSAPFVSFLVGKKAGRDSNFVRRAKNDTVYAVNVNFRSELGLFDGENEKEKAPESSKWIKKRFIDLQTADVEALSLEWPDKDLRFVKRLKKASEDKTAETTGAKAKKPEFEWVLADGPEDWELKKKVPDMLRSLTSLEAKDALDPTTPAVWGLTSPGHRATVALKGDKKVVIVAHRDPGKAANVRIEGTPAIYEVNSWDFEKAFPKGRDLFTLPSFKVTEADIVGVDIKTPEGPLVLEREEKDGSKSWRLAKPSLPDLDSSKLNDIGWGLAALTIDDYADKVTPAEAGLAPPKKTVTCRLKNGQTKSLQVGLKARSADGYYVRIDGDDRVFVMTTYGLDRVFVKRDALKKKQDEGGDKEEG